MLLFAGSANKNASAARRKCIHTVNARLCCCCNGYGKVFRVYVQCVARFFSFLCVKFANWYLWRLMTFFCWANVAWSYSGITIYGAVRWAAIQFFFKDQLLMGSCFACFHMTIPHSNLLSFRRVHQSQALFCENSLYCCAVWCRVW